jgi:hypothetical protein
VKRVTQHNRTTAHTCSLFNGSSLRYAVEWTTGGGGGCAAILYIGSATNVYIITIHSISGHSKH